MSSFSLNCWSGIVSLLILELICLMSKRTDVKGTKMTLRISTNETLREFVEVLDRDDTDV